MNKLGKDLESALEDSTCFSFRHAIQIKARDNFEDDIWITLRNNIRNNLRHRFSHRLWSNHWDDMNNGLSDEDE